MFSDGANVAVSIAAGAAAGAALRVATGVADRSLEPQATVAAARKAVQCSKRTTTSGKGECKLTMASAGSRPAGPEHDGAAAGPPATELRRRLGLAAVNLHALELRDRVVVQVRDRAAPFSRRVNLEPVDPDRHRTGAAGPHRRRDLLAATDRLHSNAAR